MRDAQSLSDPTPPPDPGQVQFCDHYVPPLKEGTYTIAINQVLTNVSPPPAGQAPLNQNFSATQTFSVLGPRFQMPGRDIQAVYPPDKSQGKFQQKLPYIVLTKRALPWELQLASNAPSTTPWLALLLFTADEIYLADSSNPTKATTYTVAQMLQSEAGILKPAISLTSLDDPDALCRAIDISPATFQTVVPQASELPYLTHCRQVNLQNKEEGQAGNGWFSVVLANRLPQNATQQPIQYIAHLVSLEGLADYIQANQPTPIPAGTNYVRLISLTSWTFNCLPEDKESFAQLMQNLVQGQASGGDGLRLKLPAKTATTPDQQSVQTIIDRGYAPLTYRVLTGEQTYAWYRGPLTPVPITDNPPTTPYATAEAALIYDQNTGVFDQSYAVAWQTGRLLALADRTFALSLLNWRQQGNQTVNLLYQRLNSPHVDAALKTTETMGQLRSLLHPKLISSTFMNYLGNEFSQASAQHVAKLGTEAAPAFQSQTNQNSQTNSKSASVENPAQPATNTLIGNLRQFMQHPQMTTLLPQAIVAQQQASGAQVSDNPTNAIPDDITDWLASLCLLYGVPFNHLVPNATMLPTESIRFFYVDPNFIDGLVDGALSLGIHSSQDSLFNQIMRPLVNTAVVQTIPTIRHRLMATTPAATGSPAAAGSDADGYQPAPALAGFVLRSAAIAGWPGLEIKLYSAYSNDQTNTPMQAVRIERITPDVLLCLCPEIPVRIEFDEPKEGLSFGVEDNNLVVLRSIQGANTGKPLSGNTVTAPLRNGTASVLNINQLAALLQQSLQSAGQLSAGTTISPSQLAIQLVRSPEQLVFQP